VGFALSSGNLVAPRRTIHRGVESPWHLQNVQNIRRGEGRGGREKRGVCVTLLRERREGGVGSYSGYRGAAATGCGGNRARGRPAGLAGAPQQHRPGRELAILPEQHVHGLMFSPRPLGQRTWRAGDRAQVVSAGHTWGYRGAGASGRPGGSAAAAPRGAGARHPPLLLPSRTTTFTVMESTYHGGAGHESKYAVRSTRRGQVRSTTECVARSTTKEQVRSTQCVVRSTRAPRHAAIQLNRIGNHLT